MRSRKILNGRTRREHLELRRLIATQSSADLEMIGDGQNKTLHLLGGTSGKSPPDFIVVVLHHDVDAHLTARGLNTGRGVIKNLGVEMTLSQHDYERALLVCDALAMNADTGVLRRNASACATRIRRAIAA